MSIQRFVAPDVITLLLFEHGLIPFDVPYTVEGTVRVYATDAESAKALVDAKSPLEYVEDGELTTHKAKAVAQ